MESIIFVVIMMAGHMLMMFIMPGMHGGHKHNEGSSAEMENLENENQQLREELNEVKSRINQDGQ